MSRRLPIKSIVACCGGVLIGYGANGYIGATVGLGICLIACALGQAMREDFE